MPRLGFLGLAGLFVLGLVLLWHYQREDARQAAEQTLADVLEPDFQLKQVSGLQFDADGALSYEFKADSVAQYPDQGHSLIIEPDLVLYHRDGTPWYITAREATISADQQTVVLEREVLVRTENPQQPLRLTTSQLTLKPKQDFIFTDRQVHIEDPDGWIEGTGMRAYLDQNRFELLAKVRGARKPFLFEQSSP